MSGFVIVERPKVYPTAPSGSGCTGVVPRSPPNLLIIPRSVAMPDNDLDQINAAFGRLRAETITQIRPEGLAAAQWVARRRRKARVAGLAVIAALVVGTASASLGSHGYQAASVAPSASPQPWVSATRPGKHFKFQAKAPAGGARPTGTEANSVEVGFTDTPETA
jgi:hypothetical protein